MGKVLAAEMLVIAIDSEYPPLSFWNDAGELDGFDVNVAQEIAKRLDVDVGFVPPEFSSIVAGNWKMLTQVNEILEGMHTDGTLTALSEKWFGIDITRQAAAN